MEIRCDNNTWKIELGENEKQITFFEAGSIYHVKANFMDKMSKSFDKAIKNRLSEVEAFKNI